MEVQKLYEFMSRLSLVEVDINTVKKYISAEKLEHLKL